MSVRLEKFLLKGDAGTYDEIKDLIEGGKVKVNGIVQTDMNLKVDTVHDFVDVGGRALNYRKFAYIVMNKPAGYLTAVENRHYDTIMDIMPDWCRRRSMKPINILDKDMSGLVLLTDDFGLQHFLDSQKNFTDMVYHVQTDKPAAIKHADMLAGGVRMKNFLGGIALLSRADSYYRKEYASRVTTKECSYLDIRKMFTAVGIEALSVELIACGDFVLPIELEEGQWRELKSDELEIFDLKSPYI